MARSLSAPDLDKACGWRRDRDLVPAILGGEPCRKAGHPLDEQMKTVLARFKTMASRPASLNPARLCGDRADAPRCAKDSKKDKSKKDKSKKAKDKAK